MQKFARNSTVPVREKWATVNPKLRHKKAKMAILFGRFGEAYGRAGDQLSWYVSIHTLKVCENLKMDILDFESPCDMLIAV